MEQKLVLQLFGEPMNCGGQEAFIMNMYRNIDRNAVQFHFYTPFDFPNLALRAEMEGLGGKAFWGGGAFESKRRKLDLVRNTWRFLKQHSYTIAHIHSGSSFNLAMMALLCRLNGIQKVIVHSHCTGIDNATHRISKQLFAPVLDCSAMGFLGCSMDAAKWRFSEKALQSNQFMVLRNGIDTDRFRFSPDRRAQLRQELGIDENAIVISQTGRFSAQKNYGFTVEVFRAFVQKHPGAILLLVGDGELRDAIAQQVQSVGLEKQVRFLGNRGDIPAILDASDAFLFPSVFEGLGISALEAQCSGLRTVCTDTLPEELTASALLTRCSLQQPPEQWAEALTQITPISERAEYADVISAAGYDAAASANCLMQVYCYDHFNKSSVSV